jgi:hypothetical protein
VEGRGQGQERKGDDLLMGSLEAKNSNEAFANPKFPSAFSKSIGLTKEVRAEGKTRREKERARGGEEEGKGKDKSKEGTRKTDCTFVRHCRRTNLILTHHQ